MLGDDALPSVEGSVWKALVAAGMVLESNAVDPNKVAFASASRTDRGVSAARFMVVAKLEMPTDACDSETGRAPLLRERLNEQLPEDVRCFSVCKVTTNPTMATTTTTNTTTATTITAAATTTITTTTTTTAATTTTTTTTAITTTIAKR